MNKIIFKGVCTAAITPFTDYGIDFDALAKQIEFQIANGVSALCFLGTTGEAATVSDEEYRHIAEFSYDKIAGRVKLILGTGANDTKTATEKSVLAQKYGADGILVVTPYYNKCTQKGVIKYYKDICSAVDVPVLCYNVPARTGFNVLPETMAEIAEIKNVGGIKEACGDMYRICETARLISGKTALYSGDDNLNLPMLAVGAAGVISVVSNIAPKETVRLTKYYAEGKNKKATALHEKMLPLINQLFTEVNPIPVKKAAKLAGLCNGILRPPLTPLEPEHERSLISEMERFGLSVNGEI